MPAAPPLRLGLDLGGTKIEAAVLDDAGRQHWRQRVATPAGNYGATLDTIVQLVTDARRAVAPPLTIGLGHPGSERADGRLKNANSTCLNGQRLRHDLEARLGQPLRLANDAGCLAVSEAIDGAGAGARLVFAVILGTGMGAGIAIDGQVLPGLHGLAGEWGHIPLPWPDPASDPSPACWCGQHGCLETLLSGPGLAADHRRHGGAADDAAAVAAAAAAGDPAASATLSRHADRLARAMALVINLLDPDVIVLGGGLSKLPGLAGAVTARWSRWVFGAAPDEPVRTRLLPARHGDASGVRGAAWLWRGAPPAD